MFKKVDSFTKKHQLLQWRSQPKIFGGPNILGGGKMVYFRQIALFSLEKRLSKHEIRGAARMRPKRPCPPRKNW